MLTDSQLLQALRDCYDPDLPCNIVDLGLILRTSITPDLEAPGANIPGVPTKSIVHIDLIPTNPTEAAIAHLRGLETVSHTTVDLLDEPRWSPARITAAGRRTLGLDGNPSLVQIR